MLYRYGKNFNNCGFTLVEVLISIAISGIMIGAIFTFSIAQSKYLSDQEQIAEMIQNARATMDMMTREINMAGYNPSIVNFDSIGIKETSQIQIRADLNANGVVSEAGNPNEDITYRFFNTAGNLYQIKRRLINGGDGGFQPFAENIQSLSFSYLDQNGNPPAFPENIRQIRVTITARTVKPDPNYHLNGGHRTYMLTSLVTPRNLALP